MKNRETLAISNACRAYLHINGFLSDSENEKVFKRIRKWQDENKVEISTAQLDSIDFTYDDNAKEEEK